MLFTYDKYSSKSGISQYEDFLDDQVYLYQLRNNVKDITNYQLLEIRKSISNNTLQMQDSIENSIKGVCISLETGISQINNTLYEINQGIEDLNWQLTDLNQGISDLYSLFDEKTNQIIEQQKITNKILDFVAKASMLPDKKKENIYNNKIGNGFLRKAILQGPESNYYNEALEAFTMANNVDKFDCISLSQIGFILLNSRENLNIINAKRLLSQASRYALDLGEGKLNDVAASSLSFESICCYTLNDLPSAINLICQAISLNPQSHKFSFQLAKYLAANGDEIKAASILQGILPYEKLYSIEILKDPDLRNKKAVLQMLDNETQKLINEVEIEIMEINKIAVNGGKVWSKLKEIEKSFYPKSYITARVAKAKLFY